MIEDFYCDEALGRIARHELMGRSMRRDQANRWEVASLVVEPLDAPG